MYELVEVKSSPIHGKGVFAKLSIPKGTEFVCDILVLDMRTKGSYLHQYTFPYGGKRLSSLCIGFPNFLNHSTDPNITIHSMDKEKLTKTFKTTKDIEVGEEITLYYTDDFQEYITLMSDKPHINIDL